ncbi:hypothetical protein TWF481_010575 [Arthrobotrys musiformis]|uniref:Nucleoside phosphorylase domain-containing protein n=1 Tax=Arthrobotrys musiformis TaxID=47236 RepID=A0AAV9W3C7_9PEZI
MKESYFSVPFNEPSNCKVHYGLVASGNSVIKNAEDRDNINACFGGKVLCIEMEAAGVVEADAIIIRGICDYADERKNDDWHDYAALVAAIYAKNILGRLQTSFVSSSATTKHNKEALQVREAQQAREVQQAGEVQQAREVEEVRQAQFREAQLREAQLREEQQLREEKLIEEKLAEEKLRTQEHFREVFSSLGFGGTHVTEEQQVGPGPAVAGPTSAQVPEIFGVGGIARIPNLPGLPSLTGTHGLAGVPTQLFSWNPEDIGHIPSLPQRGPEDMNSLQPVGAGWLQNHDGGSESITPSDKGRRGPSRSKTMAPTGQTSSKKIAPAGQIRSKTVEPVGQIRSKQKSNILASGNRTSSDLSNKGRQGRVGTNAIGYKDEDEDEDESESESEPQVVRKGRRVVRVVAPRTRI